MGDTASESIGRRYRILGTLGQGGMGTVLLVKDRLGGRVALKRLTPAEERWKDAMAAARRAEAPTPELMAISSVVGETAAALLTVPRRRDGVATAMAPLTAPRRAHEAPDTKISGDLTGAPPAPIGSAIGTASTMLRGPSAEQATVVVATNALPASASRSVDRQDAVVAELLRLTLAREFRLLSSLRHPNIISVLDYGFDDDLSPYFTMELLEGATSILKAGHAASLDGKIDLLAQTLQALAYLHRRGVIHRDLKPGNVMVEGGRVKVLDFGVSLLRERQEHNGRIIVGTLAYMAPELLLGGSATEASDLYAVGVIAFELLTGRYPFPARTVGALRDAILHHRPIFEGIEPRLVPLVKSLLEKRPQDRPSSVDDAMAALAAHTGAPLSVETAATRESFLQAAELVGREAELGALTEMRSQASAGRGQAALVGGESGVGKSRLVEELRARALVDGVVVLRGQAQPDGAPYHAFRDVLRGLVLRVEPDEREASVLGAVIPDIAALLEREVRERAAIDPEAAHARLFAAIEALLRRHGEPTLVLVEDLQWAGSESLRLFAELARASAALPLLLVGTYRDDERPALPDEVPGVRLLKLRRLGPEGVAALAASMLGEAGRRPEVIDRLIRETEGNPFFLVEVVRALAEDAGALSLVGAQPMPRTVAAGGLHLIVRRRLDQVPRRARPLLEAAAVIGRRIDPALLRRVDPAADVAAWLETCASVAVLDVDEESYRFTHDKLREGLLADLSEEAAAALHRRVAEAIEAEYPDSREHTAVLSMHWSRAGDAAKEARYAALAGEEALSSSAYREAVFYLERAVAIVSAGLPREPEGALQKARRAVAAITGIGRAPIDQRSDRFRLGRWEGRLSDAYGRLSNHAEAYRRGERALDLLGLPMPRGGAGLALGLPVQAALRALMTAWPARFEGRSERARAVLLEATRIQTRVTEACFYTQESLPMLWSGLSLLNLGEPAGPSADLACGYALMAAVAGVIPLHAAAEAWSRRALALVEQVGEPFDVAFVLQRVSSYRLWMGDFRVAEEGFTREIAIAREVGDQRLLGDALLCTVFAATYEARFSHVERVFGDLDPWMHRTGDKQLLCGGRVAEAYAKVRLGKIDEALALCEEARPIADASAVSHDDIRCYGVLALAAQRNGEPERARRAAERALAVIRVTRPVAYWTYDGLVAVAEAALMLWEDRDLAPPHEREGAASLARDAVRGLEAFAAIFPIGKPGALIWRGLTRWLSGERGDALALWDRAVAEAARLRMPYEEARARLEIGRHLAPRDPIGRRQLARASAILEDLGATTDRALAEAARARL